MTRWVTVHGFTGSPAMWAPLELPAPTTHLAVAGHGPGAAPVRHSFDDECARLAAAADAAADADNDARPAHWIGYSMGARLALAIALRFPDQVETVTLIGVHPGLETEGARAERRRTEARWCDLIESRGVDAFASVWEALPMWASQRRAAASALAAQRTARRSHDAPALASALAQLGLGAMPNLWPHLPELQVPLDVVVGDSDRKFAAIARRAVTLAPTARLTSIADAGHNPALEQPRALAEHVLTRRLP